MRLKALVLSVILLTFFSCSKESGEGPVFEGDYVLSTIDQYNSFNYVHVFGQLTIENLETADLSKLSNLKSVGGLTIRNSAMTTLEGLNNLEIIAGDLILEENPNLTSICCLNNVGQVEALSIMNHPNLIDISGLSGIQTVNKDLRIRTAPLLTSLNGLQSLTTVVGTFRMIDVGALTLEGLQSLKEVDSFYMEELPNLISAAQLTNLETIIVDLTVLNCDQLEEFATPNLKIVPIAFLGSNDALISVDFGQVITNLELLNVGGSPDLTTLTGLENVTEMGQINLSELYSLSNVNTFSGLITVLGDLRLNNLTSLTSLSGFENVTSIATEYEGNPPNYTELTITGLDALTDLSGMEQLETVGQLSISGNDNLSSLEGTSLQTSIPIGCRLFIENNANLSDFCGLTQLVNGAPINASLITDNAYNPTIQQIGSGTECSL